MAQEQGLCIGRGCSFDTQDTLEEQNIQERIQKKYIAKYRTDPLGLTKGVFDIDYDDLVDVSKRIIFNQPNHPLFREQISKFVSVISKMRKNAGDDNLFLPSLASNSYLPGLPSTREIEAYLDVSLRKKFLFTVDFSNLHEWSLQTSFDLNPSTIVANVSGVQVNNITNVVKIEKDIYLVWTFQRSPTGQVYQTFHKMIITRNEEQTLSSYTFEDFLLHDMVDMHIYDAFYLGSNNWFLLCGERGQMRQKYKFYNSFTNSSTDVALPDGQFTTEYEFRDRLNLLSSKFILSRDKKSLVLLQARYILIFSVETKTLSYFFDMEGFTTETCYYCFHKNCMAYLSENNILLVGGVVRLYRSEVAFGPEEAYSDFTFVRIDIFRKFEGWQAGHIRFPTTSPLYNVNQMMKPKEFTDTDTGVTETKVIIDNQFFECGVAIPMTVGTIKKIEVRKFLVLVPTYAKRTEQGGTYTYTILNNTSFLYTEMTGDLSKEDIIWKSSKDMQAGIVRKNANLNPIVLNEEQFNNMKIFQ